MDPEMEYNEPEDDLEAISFVCEDCDYRWGNIYTEDTETGELVCPMCGSIQTAEL